MREARAAGRCVPDASSARSYNQEVLRAPLALLISVTFLLSCGENINSKEKVQAAILERLKTKSTGLDVNDLDVNTTAVTFDKNMAYATVAIHPKGDTAVGHGMTVKYTLENHDGKWAGVKLDSPVANPMAQSQGGTDTLPPGHPSVAPGAGGTGR